MISKLEGMCVGRVWTGNIINNSNHGFDNHLLLPDIDSGDSSTEWGISSLLLIPNQFNNQLSLNGCGNRLWRGD
jgi:hypothetical protein